MIYQEDITSLESNIKEKIGQKIIIKGYLGRSKSFEDRGTIEKAYSNLFIIKYDKNESRVSYQYKDILTKLVEVDVFDGQKYNPLELPNTNVQK